MLVPDVQYIIEFIDESDEAYTDSIRSPHPIPEPAVGDAVELSFMSPGGVERRSGLVQVAKIERCYKSEDPSTGSQIITRVFCAKILGGWGA